MEIFAINGSPRKSGNTATLLKKFLEGAESVSETVHTTLINLYDLKFTGCRSCFGCKLLNGDSYGKCIIKDDLYELLPKLFNADGIALGSSIYFGDMTGEMKCFIERFLFPNFTYEIGYRSIAPKRMPIQMIYTMNVKEEFFYSSNYDKHLGYTENFIGHTYTMPKRLCAFFTYQFNNYKKYRVEAFSEPEKAEYKKTQFPKDLEAAFNAGKEMALQIRKG
jgi:multimeric flavodoxin WrbA